MSNTDDPKLFPQYVTVYQRPEDGCQSGLLASYEEAPDYWGPGDEVEVISEPIGAPLTQRTVREVFGGIEGKPRIKIASGESAVFLGGSDIEAAIVVGRTFVLVEGASADRVRAYLPQLRRVG